MRLLPILAAATIGVFAVTAINSQSSAQQATGNPSGGQNMDTATKGNPNTPSAGQTTGTGSKAAKRKSKKKARM
jgi:hypothetical protein